MARINLRPWREEYRQEKKQQFIKHLVLVALLSAMAAGAWIMLVNGSIDNQKARNSRLNSEIKLLSDQVKEIQELKKARRELLDRMRIIQELQGTRPVIVRYFDEFAESIPDGIYITNIKREGAKLSLTGVSESNNRVSTLLRNLDSSEYFDSPNLLDVDAAPSEGDQYSRFSLELTLTAPGEKEEA